MAEGGATVKYARHNLDTPDVKQHIEKGKGVVSLGLTWSDELRLSLFSSPVALQLKKLAFLDTETAAEEGEDKNARIEGQLVLESGTYSKVIDQLVEAFGGLYTETA
jgi:recombination associated protein RdgC